MTALDHLTVAAAPASLPDGWRWVRLGDVCRAQSGGTPPRGEPRYYGGDIPWAKIEDLTRAGMWIDETDESITRLALNDSAARLFPPNTVLLAMYGSIGTASIARIELSTNQAIIGCECAEDLEPRWLWYWFGLQRSNLLGMGRGGTQANLNAQIVKGLPIPLPPLAEQGRIVAILDEQLATIERARRAAQEQLVAARALSSAYLRATFESDESERWPRVPIGEVCEIVAALVDPTMPQYSQLPHVSAENIVSGEARFVAVKTAEQDGMISGKYTFDAGDVLYSKLRPYLRKVAVAEFLGLCSADMYPLRANAEQVDAPFLALVLLSDEFTRYADGESRRTRMPKLNRDQLFRWKMPVPPLDVQRTKVKSVRDGFAGARRLQSDVRECLSAIDHLPMVVSREAFSGRA